MPKIKELCKSIKENIKDWLNINKVAEKNPEELFKFRNCNIEGVPLRSPTRYCEYYGAYQTNLKEPEKLNKDVKGELKENTVNEELEIPNCSKCGAKGVLAIYPNRFYTIDCSKYCGKYGPYKTNLKEAVKAWKEINKP